MSLGTLILVTILVVIGVWLFRAFRKVRRIYRMLFYGEMPDEGQRKRTNTQNSYRRYSERPQRRKNKVFTEQDGEYVDFEEISVGASQDTQSAPGVYATEEQVEDAEWEEIK